MRGYTAGLSDVDESSSRLLVERAQSGDREALNEAFAYARIELERWIALRCGPALRSRLDIEDIVQETLSAAWRGLSRFEYRESGAFSRWLRVIADNRIRDAGAYFKAQRRSAAREKQLEQSLSASSTSPSGAMMRDEERERLLVAMASLSDTHRDVIRLIRIEGLSYAEAA